MIHIGINVRDFKAIVTHAETLKATISAAYSRPARPMQISYDGNGIRCEFTLMTTGECRSSSVTPTPAVTKDSYTAPTSQQSFPRQVNHDGTTAAEPVSHQVPTQEISIDRRSFDQSPTRNPNQGTNDAMPPPLQPASRSFTRESFSERLSKPPFPLAKSTQDAESLFLSNNDDDDAKWGEKTFDEDEDILGWDVAANEVCWNL